MYCKSLYFKTLILLSTSTTCLLSGRTDNISPASAQRKHHNPRYYIYLSSYKHLQISEKLHKSFCLTTCIQKCFNASSIRQRRCLFETKCKLPSNQPARTEVHAKCSYEPIPRANSYSYTVQLSTYLARFLIMVLAIQLCLQEYSYNQLQLV